MSLQDESIEQISKYRFYRIGKIKTLSYKSLLRRKAKKEKEFQPIRSYITWILYFSFLKLCECFTKENTLRQYFEDCGNYKVKNRAIPVMQLGHQPYSLVDRQKWTRTSAVYFSTSVELMMNGKEKLIVSLGSSSFCGSQNH
ncbi:hypothetical protein LOAG_09245 [Loa loa]|uniref:Uncharacterized protein n=1 Tax=Loa loa TaxID=7209 RepID=A0A1S0TS38_LOALO|nr:hypothetical protein LOAG_09245 [Loa loa]EFO19247.1 hypothetical protein LOAG_09245 [Loa loa]